MPTAYVVLLVSNLIFATGYSVSRIVLEDIGPATLAMTRLAIGSLILVPWAWRGMAAAKLSREDHWRLALTGVVGFTLAFALGNWGLAHRHGERRLRVRAELLRDGGPELVAAMIDELREVHLGVPRPDPDAPRASDQLHAAYKTALLDKTSSEAAER